MKANKSWFNLVAFLIIVFAIGCNKEDSAIKEDGTVSDIDKNVYHTVKIGTQTWMVENLNVTKFRNGELISNVTDDKQWTQLTSGAFCNYDNIFNNSKYGKLYNWYALKDSRGIAPIGWHIPNEQEWKELINFLGGEELAGDKMREKGTSNWESPNTGANNSSGFTALPAGRRISHDGGSYDIQFSGLGDATCFWSSTESENTFDAKSIFIISSEQINLNSLSFSSSFKTCGNSIRCIKD